MFTTPSPIEAKIDAEILSVLAAMNGLEKFDENYATLVKRLSELHKLKVEESPRPKQVSPDTMLAVAANIFGILWIARYERDNVINGKSLNFVMKPRS